MNNINVFKTKINLINEVVYLLANKDLLNENVLIETINAINTLIHNLDYTIRKINNNKYLPIWGVYYGNKLLVSTQFKFNAIKHRNTLIEINKPKIVKKSNILNRSLSELNIIERSAVLTQPQKVYMIEVFNNQGKCLGFMQCKDKTDYMTINNQDAVKEVERRTSLFPDLTFKVKEV